MSTPTTPTPARMNRADKWILGGVAALVFGGLLLIAIAAQPAADERAERIGSTRVATPGGAKALFEYLERAKLSPTRVETQDLSVPAGTALALIDVHLDEGEADVLVRRVEEGLMLFVASAAMDSPLFERLALEVRPDGAPGRAIAAWPSPAVRGVRRVEVEGNVRARLGGDGLPGSGWVELLAEDAGAVAVSRRIGAGEVIVLLDPAVISNAGLAKAHNLRFADSALRHLAGASGAVAFDEFHHGYGVERTVTAWIARAGLLPATWLAVLALIVDALRRHHLRVGPPRPPPAPERRAVREFIASYAGLLRAAGHRRYAVRALERTLRRRLQDDLGIPVATPPAEVFRKLTTRAPAAAARAYRALERASDLARAPGAEVSDRDLLDLAQDVRLAEGALTRHHPTP